MGLKIYTIGHSNIEPGEFIKRVKQFNIEVLVDVRSKPYSQYVPHFNKEKIEQLCANNEIKYLFLGDLLGGKPKDNSIYDKEEKVNYELLAKKDYFLAGIDRLLNLAKKYRICLMCSEGQPDECHRNRLLGPALEKIGIEALHILSDGTVVDSEQLKLEVNKGQLALF